MFSHVDGAEAHGYVRSPPIEETVAAHLCPAAAKTLGSAISLPSKPCRTTAHLANKAYASDGEAASALHAMAVLQVFQAKILQAAEGGALTAEATKDLRAATDFALMVTKRAAQAVGKAMGFMVVLQRHLMLNLADLKEADRKVLLNAPVTPSGLFGDAVESITDRFAEAQKRAKAMSHVMPRCTFQQQTARSRYSSAPGSAQRRDIPRSGPAVGTATAPRQEPDVRRKAWGPGRKRQGQRRSPRCDSHPPFARRNYGAFMCGCFRVVRGAKCITVSRDRHTHGSASTLYKTFVCLKMGSVCEMAPSGSYRRMFWVSCNTGWIVDRYLRHWKSMWQPLPRFVPRRADSRSAETPWWCVFLREREDYTLRDHLQFRPGT